MDSPLLPCGRCGRYDHATGSSSVCPGPIRCCPRCGSMNHDGRTTALCPDPQWMTPVVITRPEIVRVPVNYSFGEIVVPGEIPR